jgi:hypothetical protein
MASKTVLRALGAPAVLLAVAASHVTLRSSSDLTPWKGGGFGMFSPIDSPGSRLGRVRLHSEIGATEVAVPAALSAPADEVRAVPAPGRLQQFAGELARQVWVVPRLPVDPGVPPDEARALDELAVQTMVQFLPADAVRAVAAGDVDDRRQRRLAVDTAEVVVLRLVPASDGDRTTLRPEVIRRASAPADPAIGGR